MFFKNRAVQITFPKTQEASTNAAPNPDIIPVDPEQIAKIATDFAVKTIGAVGIAIAANRVLKTVCDIAVITAQAKLK